MNDLELQRASYPRVSDIISKQNERELRSIPLNTLAEACIRGTKVHEYCSAHMQNMWLMEIDPRYAPYFDAFVKWKEENVKSLLKCGIRLFDDVKRFTGEFDMIVRLKNDKIALIDIKTSSVASKSWPVQLAAYAHLCKLHGYEFDVICNIHLKKQAYSKKKEEENLSVLPVAVQAVLIEYKEIALFWDIFSSALHCYDYFEKKEIKNA